MNLAKLFSFSRAALKTIDATELARHNRPGDAWVAIDGVVYDVSTYEKKHPGGKILVANAGSDLSFEFHEMHRPSTEKVLAKLPKVATLRPPTPDPNVRLDAS